MYCHPPASASESVPVIAAALSRKNTDPCSVEKASGLPGPECEGAETASTSPTHCSRLPNRILDEGLKIIARGDAKSRDGYDRSNMYTAPEFTR